VDFDANLLVPECEIQDPSGHHRNASDNDNSSRCQGHRIKDATSSSSSDKLAIGDDAAVEVRQPLPELTLSPPVRDYEFDYRGNILLVFEA
jgi:hypothetical protein